MVWIWNEMKVSKLVQTYRIGILQNHNTNCVIKCINTLIKSMKASGITAKIPDEIQKAPILAKNHCLSVIQYFIFHTLN